MNDIKSKIRTYLSRPLRDYELKDDDNIFELGLVSSLFAIQLILFIEKEFDLELEDEELDLEQISTLKDITDLVEQKKSLVTC